MRERDGVRMASKAGFGFEQMDIVIGAFESPQGCNTSAATTDYGYFLSVLHRRGEDVNVMKTADSPAIPSHLQAWTWDDADINLRTKFGGELQDKISASDQSGS